MLCGLGFFYRHLARMRNRGGGGAAPPFHPSATGGAGGTIPHSLRRPKCLHGNFFSSAPPSPPPFLIRGHLGAGIAFPLGIWGTMANVRVLPANKAQCLEASKYKFILYAHR